MKNWLVLSATLLALSSVSFSVQAWERGACREDIEKYCKNVEVGNERIRNCLKSHAEKLSTGCKANLFDAAMKKEASKKK